MRCKGNKSEKLLIFLLLNTLVLHSSLVLAEKGLGGGGQGEQGCGADREGNGRRKEIIVVDPKVFCLPKIKT